MQESEVRERIREYIRFPVHGKLRYITDTTEFMSIREGDILELGSSLYLVRGEESEGRFGLDGEPKFWVKKAVDLSDGSSKIIKLVFHESFMMHLGLQQIQCFRSPGKEARILEKTHKDPDFMQGYNVLDGKGNVVRIIDRINGARFYDFILDLSMDHRTYFYTLFPDVFRNVVSCAEAIDRLHRMEELHGDIRNDHIIIDRETGKYTWIDFDYTYEWYENPFGVDLFGLGNVLLLAVGKGFYNLPDFNACGPQGIEMTSCLTGADLSLFFKHRVINLQKLFPYIPDSLMHVLMHFSQGAEVFYETAREFLEDLRACEAEIVRGDETPRRACEESGYAEQGSRRD